MTLYDILQLNNLSLLGHSDDRYPLFEPILVLLRHLQLAQVEAFDLQWVRDWWFRHGDARHHVVVIVAELVRGGLSLVAWLGVGHVESLNCLLLLRHRIDLRVRISH